MRSERRCDQTSTGALTSSEAVKSSIDVALCSLAFEARVPRLTHLKLVVSLKSPSSSDTFVLCTREAVREVPFETFLEPVAETCLERAFLETVLPLSSSTCLRRSCILMWWW